jgi:hypothetical protein
VIETQQSCLLAFGTIQAFPHTTMSCVPSYCAHLRNPIIIDDVVPQPPVQITC